MAENAAQTAETVADVTTAQAAETTTETTAKPEMTAEKVVSKKLFDEKMSELNKKNKDLEAKLKAKMSEEEIAAAESLEKDAELKAIKAELTAIKTEGAFLSAGIKPETAKDLSAAIVSGDVSAIVDAVKTAVAAAEKDAGAKKAKELLEKGSPNVPAVAGDSKESPDPYAELVKSAVGANRAATPLSKSKWF